MRCRPGDLAVVVGPGVVTTGLLGRFVIVERLVAIGEEIVPGHYADADFGDAWWCRAASSDGKLPFGVDPWTIEVLRRPVCDSILRPIRPNEGEDETLSRARRPVEDLV